MSIGVASCFFSGFMFYRILEFSTSLRWRFRHLHRAWMGKKKMAFWFWFWFCLTCSIFLGFDTGLGGGSVTVHPFPMSRVFLVATNLAFSEDTMDAVLALFVLPSFLKWT